MNPDLLFFLGLLASAAAFPALLTAFSSSDRSFRAPVLLIVVGFSLIAWASSSRQGGYSTDDIPRVIGGVLKSLFGT